MKQFPRKLTALFLSAALAASALALPTVAEGSTVLRPGDEVIITAGGLYDGKVVREEI